MMDTFLLLIFNVAIFLSTIHQRQHTTLIGKSVVRKKLIVKQAFTWYFFYEKSMFVELLDPLPCNRFVERICNTLVCTCVVCVYIYISYSLKLWNVGLVISKCNKVDMDSNGWHDKQMLCISHENWKHLSSIKYCWLGCFGNFFIG